MTKQKQVIMDVITASSEHLTADQIYMKAKERLPKIPEFGTDGGAQRDKKVFGKRRAGSL